MLAPIVLSRVLLAALVALVLLALATSRATGADGDPVLLSFETLASASSGAGVDRVVDGDPGTRWESDWGVDPQWIQVDLGAIHALDRVVLDWELARASAYTLEVSDDGDAWTVAHTATEADPQLVGSSPTAYRATIDVASHSARYVRVVGTARTTGYGYSLYAFDVYGTATPEWEDLAFVDATASSSRGSNDPARAIDGDGATRWESVHGDDDQYLEVDLGGVATVSEVVIDWEAAMASDYDVEASLDGVAWTTVAEARSQSVAGEHIVAFTTPTTARYIRVTGLGRTTSYGYSIWEITASGYGFVAAQAFGADSGDADDAAAPGASSSPNSTPSSAPSSGEQDDAAAPELAATGPSEAWGATSAVSLIVCGAVLIAAARRPSRA